MSEAYRKRDSEADHPFDRLPMWVRWGLVALMCVAWGLLLVAIWLEVSRP